jgi:hypothetical protein
MVGRVGLGVRGLELDETDDWIESGVQRGKESRKSEVSGDDGFDKKEQDINIGEDDNVEGSGGENESEEEEESSEEGTEGSSESETGSGKEGGRKKKEKGKMRGGETETEVSSAMSELDELGFGGGGVPMQLLMRRNLAVSDAVEEEGQETKLGVKHALSAIQYRPRKSSFKVESTGKYLRKSLGRARTFDPFAYVMTKEARQAEESREKTLCLDFVVAKPVPRVAGESVLLPSVSAMLTKCYNKFLFIAKCMEKGDERAIWAMLKDGVFSTADSLTRIQDLRVEAVTGSSAYSTRASAEVGLIREKAKERWQKTLGKPGSFFRTGGGK